jgi:hypothetical protein
MAWLMAGGLSTNGDVLEEVQTSLGQLRQPAAVTRVRAYSGAADLLASPLFALTTGPGAVREPSIRGWGGGDAPPDRGPFVDRRQALRMDQRR